MTQLELFQAFVAPAIFISAAGLLLLSVNVRLMGMVTRLRAFHKEKHLAMVAGKKQEAIILQAQIKSIEHRAIKIKNAFLFILIGALGTMLTCLILGLVLYFPAIFAVAVMVFVLSVSSMLLGCGFYISEVMVALSSEKEEEKLYELLDVVFESTHDTSDL